jgi:hypothetical protein
VIVASVLHDIAGRHQFHVGLEWGVALGVAAAVLGLLSTVVLRRPAPIAGLVVAGAFVFAVKPARALTIGYLPIALPTNVCRGLVYLAAAGLVVELLVAWHPSLGLLGLVVTIPGAVVITHQTRLPTEHWVAPLVVATTVVGGTLVADLDRRHARRGWGPVLFAITVVGVYFTVPDTELALVLLGASLPLIVLGWPFALTSIGWIGAYPAVGVLAWTAAYEGVGRPAAIIAAVACLGLFVVEPITRLLLGLRSSVFDSLPERWWLAIPIAIVHLALVVVVARVGGVRTSLKEASGVAIVTLLGAIVLLWAFDAETADARWRGRDDREDR